MQSQEGRRGNGNLGLQQVRVSGENLKQLSNIVKDNSSAVRQIAAAVSQQNAGITQIFSAVLASSVTVITVFVPLVLIPGLQGLLFTPFAVMVMVAVARAAFGPSP